MRCRSCRSALFWDKPLQLRTALDENLAFADIWLCSRIIDAPTAMTRATAIAAKNDFIGFPIRDCFQRFRAVALPGKGSIAPTVEIIKSTQPNQQKKAAQRPPSVTRRADRTLALRELEAAAGFRAAELLALHHAAVAGEEAFLLERGAKRRLVIGQRLGDAVTHRASLA
jgi:hypothetical protein